VSRWPNKYVIGLTGNIAVGKSVVRQMAQHLGAYPIDADGLGHQAMAPGAPAYKPIVQTFGQLILDEDKRINRKMLGSIVFSNPTALAKLESITHPVIRQAIDVLVSRAKSRIVIIEAIKLLEGGLADMVDEVWVVDARPEVQYRRLIEKRKMSPEEAKQRILAQGAQAEKLKKANVVIRNDGDIEATWKQVQSAWNQIVQKLDRASAASEPAPAQKPAADAVHSAPTQPTRPATQPLNQPAASAPAPTSSNAQTMQENNETEAASIEGVNVRRGMPTNADSIARFISSHSGRQVGRMDVMMAFGEKSFLLAQDDGEQMLGLMGWQVENLITRVDEFYMDPAASKHAVIESLLRAMESASKELQSEVSFVFLPSSASQEIFQTFASNGYEETTPNQIKIPAWREALQNVDTNTMQILHKKLRHDRVLTPI
jgi:dephospho-CoA kinase